VKKIFFFIIALSFVGSIYALEYKDVYDLSGIKASNEIIKLIKNDILTWINDDVIIQAVNEANKKYASRTLDQVKAADKEWIESKEITTFMKELMENKSAVLLKDKIKKSQNLYAEIFTTDFQGCIVGETERSSDYWQGDEDKFIKTYGAGGKIFIDKIKYDESSKTSSMQISLPLYDAKAKKMIGSITITVDMDKKELLKKI
jgi:K+-sensing histidine kinase KdpD